MKKIKIYFTDFWRGFSMEDNYFVDLLSKRFEIEITDRPDYLLYGPYGKQHRKFRCIKIFYTAENVRPNFWECDYAFTFDFNNSSRHYRLPLYAQDDLESLTRSKDIEKIKAEKTEFCNFVYSNRGAQERINFFKLLSQYKKVDAGGDVENNLGYKVKDKLSFLNKYRFTIAFENASYPGYTTEKIIHPMLVNSIPIYWGNPLVHLDFNTKSFINVHEYPSFDAVVDRIKELESNQEAYLKVLRQPFLNSNAVSHLLRREAFLDQFEKIFTKVEPESKPIRMMKRSLSYFRNDCKQLIKRIY